MSELKIKKKERNGVRGNPWCYNPELDAPSLVLSNCLDFKLEKSQLQDLVEKRGHILLISVKCHPEMAGVGIEYCWGKLKYEHKNSQKEKRKAGAEFKDSITKLLRDRSILSMSRIWKFSRRTREYMLLYVCTYMQYDEHLQSDGQGAAQRHNIAHISHTELENMKRKCKTHTNIMELEKAYIETTD